MSNKARKFKRVWIVTAEGKSRGQEGETFFEKGSDGTIRELYTIKESGFGRKT